MYDKPQPSEEQVKEGENVPEEGEEHVQRPSGRKELNMFKNQTEGSLGGSIT